MPVAHARISLHPLLHYLDCAHASRTRPQLTQEFNHETHHPHHHGRLAVTGLATSAGAQTRHDERSHGHNGKVSAEQQANTTKVNTFATGPRPHDAVRRVAKATPAAEPAPMAKTQEK